jgi:hypothetical protein
MDQASLDIVEEAKHPMGSDMIYEEIKREEAPSKKTSNSNPDPHEQ